MPPDEILCILRKFGPYSLECVELDFSHSGEKGVG